MEAESEALLQTNLVSLSRGSNGVFVLSLNSPEENPENRWTLAMCIDVHKAFDKIEEQLENDERGTPAALLTVSKSPKFFSNGIDPSWLKSDPPQQDLLQWNDLTMSAFARPILLPIPTVCSINGHAFGAGMMFAIAHDYLLQRQDRGYQCAIEIAIGIRTPPPELSLFRHCMSAGAFHETVLHARRWTGDDAKAAGFVHQSLPLEKLQAAAMEVAATQAKQLGGRRHVMKHYKDHLKGFVAEEILAYTFSKGTSSSDRPLPPGLQKHVTSLFQDKASFTWARAHCGMGSPLAAAKISDVGLLSSL